MNVLLITADEMRGDCTGYIGNPDVKTPHLDALASSGTVFENHFAPFPKCVPSRCSMHTGRYTHTDGLRTVSPANHLPKGMPNLGEFLRTQGFETAVLGINHLWEDSWFYGEGDRQNKRGGGAVDYTSFTEDLAPLAKTKRSYPPGTPRSGPHIDALAEVDYQGLVTGTTEAFCDENRADQACYFLKQVRDPAKPFFLQLNLSKPHPPYGIHEPFYSMYDPAAIQPFPHGLPTGASLPLRAQREWRLGNNIPTDSLRELQAIYYGMISLADDLVGKVLATLKESGLAEDTLVIFTSDHGDFAGQYGINEKWDASLQDCLLRVPILIAGPGVPSGKRIQGLSEHVDLPATILEFLKLTPPPDWVWHGESLVPTLDGGPTKTAVFADGGHEAAMRARFDAPVYKEEHGKRVKTVGGKQLTYQQCPDAMARCKMVRTEEWKLVIRETGGNELFHIADDPDEMTNLYADPQHAAIVSDLQLKLIEWCLRTDTDRPFLKTFGA
ncbi:sulfatase-like hydrolase/transferase [Haloferula sp.]|uniref:sulfatase-like hydrolase/transferase n=1 Tax=Haloferula sp. TaxID=2497595 RepID=UPI003C7595B2